MHLCSIYLLAAYQSAGAREPFCLGSQRNRTRRQCNCLGARLACQARRVFRPSSRHGSINIINNHCLSWRDVQMSFFRELESAASLNPPNGGWRARTLKAFVSLLMRIDSRCCCRSKQALSTRAAGTQLNQCLVDVAQLMIGE